jgi:hypothetical protein
LERDGLAFQFYERQPMTASPLCRFRLVPGPEGAAGWPESSITILTLDRQVSFGRRETFLEILEQGRRFSLLEGYPPSSAEEEKPIESSYFSAVA